MVCLGTGEEQQGVGIAPAVNLPSVTSMDRGMLPFHADMSAAVLEGHRDINQWSKKPTN